MPSRRDPLPTDCSQIAPWGDREIHVAFFDEHRRLPLGFAVRVDVYPWRRSAERRGWAREEPYEGC
jgi:hypothetical protein